MSFGVDHTIVPKETDSSTASSQSQQCFPHGLPCAYWQQDLEYTHGSFTMHRRLPDHHRAHQLRLLDPQDAAARFIDGHRVSRSVLGSVLVSKSGRAFTHISLT